MCGALTDTPHGPPWGGDEWASEAALARLKPEHLGHLTLEQISVLCQRLLATGEVPGLKPEVVPHVLCIALAAEAPGVKPDDLLRVCAAQDIPLPDDTSLIPEPIAWTLRGVLSSPVTLSLDSPVIHVFLVMQGEQVDEVLVVGRGCGEVRRRVYDAAFLAAMAAPLFDLDVLNDRIRELEQAAGEAESQGDDRAAGQCRQRVRWLAGLRKHPPAEVLDGLIRLSRHAVDPYTNVPVKGLGRAPDDGPAEGASSSISDVDDMFVLLVQELRGLAQASSLVEVHEVTPEEVKLFRPRPSYGNGDDAVTFHDTNPAPDRSVVAAVGGVWEIDRLQFGVPGYVFASDLYRRVSKVMFESKVARTLADAEDRYRFYDQHCRENGVRLEQYKSLSEAERKKKDAEDIRLDVRVDIESGRQVALRRPDFVKGGEYYHNILPRLLEREGTWRERMRRIIVSVNRAREDGRLERLVRGYLLDRAMRNLPPGAGDPTWPRLARWQERVRPLLLHAWQEFLQKKRGVADPASYATRRIFFTTRFDDDGRTVIWPQYLFVNTTSVMDLSGPVQRLVDRIDRLEAKPGPAESDDDRKRLDAALSSETSVLCPGDRAVELRNALLRDPVSAVGRISRHFVESRTEATPPSGQPDPMLARRTLEAAAGLERIGAFYGAMRCFAEFLDEAVREPPPPEFDLPENRLPEVPLQFVLLRALVDPNDRPVADLVDQWRAGAGTPPLVGQALELAERWEAGYIETCLAALRDKDKKETATSEALRVSLRGETGLSAVPGLLEGAQDAIDAARETLRARQGSSGRAEPRRMYRLLGEALARITVLTKGVYVQDDVQEISDLLLGAEHYLNEKGRQAENPEDGQ